MAGRQDVFQQAMNQGHSAAWDQLWDRAAGFYRQALEEFPDHPQALTNLGLALIELQEYEQALHCYVKAAKTLPEDPVPLEKIAQLYERLGGIEQAAQALLRSAELYLKKQYADKATECWEHVTRLNPENMRAHSRLALVYERTGEKEKSVQEYLAVASLFQATGDNEKATASVNQALKVVPNHDTAIQAMILLRDFKPLPKPARPRGGTAPLRMSQVRQLKAPKELNLSDQGLDPVAQAAQKALTILAGLLFEGAEDEQQEGRRGLQAIVTGTGTGSLRKPVDQTRLLLHLSQVVDLQTKGNLSQAAEELQRATDVGLDLSAGYFDLGYLYADAGRLESAIRILQHALKNADFALGTRLLLGSLYRKKNQLKDSAIEYMEALRLADAQVVAPEQANDLRQLYDPLIEAYRQQNESEIQPRVPDNIHDMLMRANWRENLIRAREQLPGRELQGPPRPLAEILIEARSSQVIEAISHIYEIAKRGDTRAAMEDAFYALDSASTYLPLHTVMGELLIKQGELQAATAKFLVVARTYSTRGEALQAVNLYRKIVELSPTDLNVRTRLIEQLNAGGHQEEAVNESINLAEVHYSLADLAQARKTYTDALRAAQQGNLDRALRVKILHRMADIDMQSLDWRQAMRIFEQIRTLQPDDMKARGGLIDLNFRLGQEAPAIAELDDFLAHLSSNNQESKALTFLQNLVQENPERVPMRRRLADLYRHLGKVAEAIEQLDAIGELLLQVGDRPHAVQTIETILILNPPNRVEYEQLLEQIRSGKM